MSITVSVESRTTSVLGAYLERFATGCSSLTSASEAVRFVAISQEREVMSVVVGKKEMIERGFKAGLQVVTTRLVCALSRGVKFVYLAEVNSGVRSSAERACM